MSISILNLGYGNAIPTDKIIAITAYDTSPIKQKVKQAKENGTLIDLTRGKATKTVILLEGGGIVSSSFSSDALMKRLTQPENKGLE